MKADDKISEFSACYTEYKENTGDAGEAHTAKRPLIGEAECKKWCDETAGCKAAIISPVHRAQRECFIASTVDVTERTGWFAAIKNAPCLGRLKIAARC